MTNKYLSIYLNDHLALLVATSALAGRTLESNQGTELGRCLEDIVESIGSDRDVLEALMEQHRVAHNWTKTTGARVAERVGRLKLNGQIRGYSPLSRLVELESLELAMSGVRSFWDTLHESGITQAGGTSTAELAEKAEQHLQDLCGHRRAAGKQVLVTPVGAPGSLPE